MATYRRVVKEGVAIDVTPDHVMQLGCCSCNKLVTKLIFSAEFLRSFLH